VLIPFKVPEASFPIPVFPSLARLAACVAGDFLLKTIQQENVNTP